MAVAGIAVLAWAIFARTWNVGQRPFWQDEACWAEMVERAPYADLLTQAELPAPPLFAVASKLIGSWVRPPEIGLRLLSIVCGVAVVPLVYVVARTLGAARSVALAAMTLSSSNILLVIWSREFHQYEVEAVFAVLLAWLVFRVRREARPRARIMLATAILLTSGIGPWFGYGMTFAAAPLLGLLVVLRPIAGRGALNRAAGLVSLAALGISLLVLARQVGANQADNEALRAFMGNWFIDPGDLTTWLRAAKYGTATTCMMLVPIPIVRHMTLVTGLGLLIWLVALIGIRTWPRRGRIELACWVVAPWLLLMIAAVLHQYPFGVMRTMAFVAPGMCVALAGGVVNIGRACAQVFVGRGAPGIVVAAIATAAPIGWVVQVPLANRYWIRQDFPGVLGVLESQRGPLEPVLVMRAAVPSVRYYAGQAGASFTYVPLAAGTRPVPRFDYLGFIRNELRTAGARFWLLTTNDSNDEIRQQVFSEARRLGYEARRVAGPPVGEDDYDEVAQLYRIERVRAAGSKGQSDR